jgi:hypothetical protein
MAVLFLRTKATGRATQRRQTTDRDLRACRQRIADPRLIALAGLHRNFLQLEARRCLYEHIVFAAAAQQCLGGNTHYSTVVAAGVDADFGILIWPQTVAGVDEFGAHQRSLAIATDLRAERDELAGCLQWSTRAHPQLT